MPSLLPLAARRVFGLFALAALMTTLVACSKAEAPQEPLRSVKLLTVAGSDLNLASEFSAEVRARVESRLGFRVGGKLVQRPAEPGQRVAAGQLLALVDAQDFQLAAQAAQAQVSAAQSQRDLAAAEFKRFEALKAQNFISGAELERREASLKTAEAALNQAKAQAQAQGNQAGYARLTASHAGVIIAVEAEVGQVVSAGQPVVRLAHDGPRDAVFAVSESAIMSIRLGQSMQAMVLSTGQMVQGTVREMAASADPVTRTYAVKLALAPGVGGALPLGATLNVRAPGLSSAVASAIKLPTSALRQEGQGTAVWVLDEATMTVNSQAVQLGPVDGNEVVVSSGLKPGQKVVSAGVHVLSPGQKVTVYGAAPTPASAPGAVPAPSASAPR
uniref:efflux RND transporter periplasmic adaptor subunit n=1 Tax=Limnohabitans sp. TaxID=1907725 RepID=UPI00404835D9